MLAEKKVEKTQVYSRNKNRMGSVCSKDNKDEKLFIRVTAAEKDRLQQISAERFITISNLIMSLVSSVYL